MAHREVIEVKKSDLVYLLRLLDSLHISIDLDFTTTDLIDIDNVLIDLDEASNIVETYLK